MGYRGSGIFAPEKDSLLGPMVREKITHKILKKCNLLPQISYGKSNISQILIVSDLVQISQIRYGKSPPAVGNDRTPKIEVRPDGQTSSLWVRLDVGPEVPAGPIAGP